MKLLATSAISLLITVSFSSCGQGFKNRSVLGEQSAKEQVRLALLADKNSVAPPHHKALLTSKEVAIAVAEPILFNTYGKDNIVRQRPYCKLPLKVSRSKIEVRQLVETRWGLRS